MKIFHILVKNFYFYFYGRKEFIKTLLFIKLIVSYIYRNTILFKNFDIV